VGVGLRLVVESFALPLASMAWLALVQAHWCGLSTIGTFSLSFGLLAPEALAKRDQLVALVE